MDKFQNKYRIPTARAQWHGYDGGIYFVTICTAERLHLFGEITDSQMWLSDIGRIAYDNFVNVTVHYPYAEILLFTVMPNHIHAIVVIDEKEYNKKSSSPSVETMCTSSLQQQQRWKTDIVNDKMRIISHKRGALSIVIGGLKRAVTCYAHENGIKFAWQSRFHDRIIRNQEELNRIAEYIETNVAKWDLDELNEINNNDK